MIEKEKKALSSQLNEEKENKQAHNKPFLTFTILSLFPEFFTGPFDVSMIKRARDRNLIDIQLVNIRDFAEGKHRKADERPFGGGPGMVLMPKPTIKAIRKAKRQNSHVVYLSPQGKPLNAKRSRELAEEEHVILLCGHYEGVDQRIIDLEVDEEISIGDFVLTNGGPAAIALVDAVVRFVPGVIGRSESVENESFEKGIFDSPIYTTPVEFEGHEVPAVLREGNHKKIDTWRNEKAYEKTKKVRPDLA